MKSATVAGHVAASRAPRACLAACAALACALATSLASGAPAQPRVHPPVTAEGRELARKLAERGYEQYEAGDCKGAKESFVSAERNFHAPPHLLFIARCEAKLGHLIAARELYQEVLDEKLAPDAPPPFLTAQKSAKSELEEIDIRLPTIEVAIRAGETGPIAITLDGVPLPAAELNKGKPVDPGTHTVGATAADGQRFARTITTKDGGGATRIEISFGVQASTGSVVPAFIAFGVGAAGVALGTVTGIGSLSKVGDLKTACPNQRCSPAEQPTADSAKTLGTLSTIGFILGGVGAAGGVTLLVLRPKWFSSDPAAPPKTGQAPPTVNVAIAPTGFGMTGTF